MKVAERVINVESTMGDVETMDMVIDAEAMAHIMVILTDMYPDPQLAVLREYSTNARDSHVEAGCPERPIEVTLPTELSPFLTIRDFGVGLNAEDIRNVYSRYGASTKRGTNDAIGMLGLGSKSGLAYADQFTVSAVKDGVQTEIIVTRQANGVGGMQIPVTFETDEPNGVTITIPAAEDNDFEAKAAELFRFWPEGSVLVDGQAPKRIGTETGSMWIADDLLLTRETGEAMTVVMGGVPYGVPGEYRDGEMNLVAFVDIGDVNFAPNREDLLMNDVTRAKVEQIKEREVNERLAALTKLIEAAPTHHDAARIAQEASAMGLKGEVLYKGEQVPYRYTRREGQQLWAVPARKRYKSRGYEPVGYLPVHGSNRAFLVGLTVTSFTPYKRQKFDQWYGKQAAKLADGESLPAEYFVADVLDPEQLKWLDPAQILDWADVEAEKIAKTGATGARGTVVGTYDAYTSRVDPATGEAERRYVREHPADEIVPRNLYYYQGRGGHSPEGHPGIDLVRQHHGDEGATVVVLPGNRIGKFLRDFKSAKRLDDAVVELAKARVASLTDDDKFALAVAHARSSRVPTAVTELDAKRVDDPVLAQIIEAAKKGPDLSSELSDISRWARPDLSGVAVPEVAKAYPLLGQIYTYNRVHDHIYIYLNAAYAEALAAAPVEVEEAA